MLLVQVAVFLLVAWVRRRGLLGLGLKEGEDAALGRYLARTTRSKGRITGRQLGLAREHPFPLLVLRERWYHRLLKRLGLAAELQLGDAALDRRWFLVTDDPVRLRRALASKALRAPLAELLALPIEGIRAGGDRAWLEIAAADFAEPDAHFRRHLELLGAVQDGLAGLRVAQAEERPGSRRGLAYAALSVHAGLLLAGVAGLVAVRLETARMVEPWKWIAVGLALGAVAASAWLLLLARRLRETAWMGWLLADFALAGLPGFLLAGVLVARAADLGLDHAPPAIATVRVRSTACALACSTGSGKGRKTTTWPLAAPECAAAGRPATLEAMARRDPKCASGAAFKFTVTVEHWLPGHPPWDLDAGAARYDRAAPGRPVEVPVHPGALGLAWVEPGEVNVPP